MITPNISWVKDGKHDLATATYQSRSRILTFTLSRKRGKYSLFRNGISSDDRIADITSDSITTLTRDIAEKYIVDYVRKNYNE